MKPKAFCVAAVIVLSTFATANAANAEFVYVVPPEDAADPGIVYNAPIEEAVDPGFVYAVPFQDGRLTAEACAASWRRWASAFGFSYLTFLSC